MNLPFIEPLVLFALIIPVGLIVASCVRGGYRVSLPFDHQPNQHGAWWHAALSIVGAIPKLLLALLILLLAKPVQYEQPKQERELTNIQFCIDVSGSMTSEFGASTRYDAAMLAMNEFIALRDGDDFALTIFGGEYLHWVPLTSDPSAFKYAAPFLQPENLPYGFGSTEIGKALYACEKEMVKRKEGDRMIILISDGESWDLGGENTDKVIAKMRESKIAVYAIHIGEDQVPEDVATISTATGGAYFPVGDMESLTQVFLHIDKMKKVKLKRITPDKVDHFFPYVVIGLSLLGLYVFSLLGLRYNPW